MPEQEKYYYLISLNVPGPYTNFPDDNEVTREYANREDIVIENARSVLADFGVRTKHAWSWTDGACYWYGVADKPISIEDFPRYRELFLEILQVPPSQYPHKARCKTLKEYMKDAEPKDLGSN